MSISIWSDVYLISVYVEEKSGPFWGVSERGERDIKNIL
jgi:hypothetical protein